MAKVAMRKINIAGDRDEEWDTAALTKGWGGDRGPFRTAFELSPRPIAQSGLSGPGGLFAFTLSVQVWDERNAALSWPPSISPKHSRRSHAYETRIYAFCFGCAR